MPEVVVTKEISEKLDKSLNILTEFQTKYTELEKKVGELDSLDKESLGKMTEDLTKTFQNIQDLKAEQELLVKEQEEIKKELHRMPSGNTENDKFNPRYIEEFTKWMRTGFSITQKTLEDSANDFSKTLKGVSEEKMQLFAKDLLSGINPQGGYWVQPDRISATIGREFETSPIRRFANTVTTSSDIVEMVLDDDELGEPQTTGELDTVLKTETPDIGLKSIPVHENAVEPKITGRLLQDSGFDAESWLNRKISERLSRKENRQFVLGVGATESEGFLTLPAWSSPGVYQRDAIEQINSGAATALTSDGIIDLQVSLKEPYQARAIFMTKRVNFGDIMKLKDLNGQYLLNPSVIKEGAEMILLGRTLVFADDIPTVAGGALAMIYGDFSQGYTIVDKIGITLIRDIFTDKRFVKFHTKKRVGGAITNFEALKIQKIAA